MKNHTLTKISGFFVLAITLILCSSCNGTENVNAGDQPGGGITGHVFLDENADKVFQECDCDCELEDVSIRLYVDRCAGLVIQKVKTDSNGLFSFEELEPGDYCVMPEPKLFCEGYQATTSITQRIQVKAGETVDSGWFGFDHYVDTNP